MTGGHAQQTIALSLFNENPALFDFFLTLLERYSSMKWEKETEELFRQFLENVPGLTRTLARTAIHKASEQRCEERDGHVVTTADFIVGIFRSTPHVFQSRARDNLESLGVEYAKYIDTPQRRFKKKIDLKRLQRDLISIGTAFNITCDEARIERVLKAYRPYFETSLSSLNILTTPSKSNAVSVEYFELLRPHDPDPLTTAIKEGFIIEDGHRIFDMFEEARETFDVTGYGVHLDVSRGLSQLFLMPSPSSVESLFVLDNLPKNVQSYTHRLARYGLNHFSLFAFDFIEKCIEMCFMVKDPSQMTSRQYHNLLREFAIYADDDELLEYCANACIITFRFSWQRDCVEKVGFAVLSQEESGVPDPLHPMLDSMLSCRSSLRNATGGYIVGIAFSPEGLYFKIDKDYSGTMIDGIKRVVDAGVTLYPEKAWWQVTASLNSIHEDIAVRR